jgi:hypothetical protein
VLALLALYLVVRAAIEVATVDPTKPDTYRHDWGGPHYLGVLLVHTGPGIAVSALLARRRVARPGRTGDFLKDAHGDLRSR